MDDVLDKPPPKGPCGNCGAPGAPYVGAGPIGGGPPDGFDYFCAPTRWGLTPTQTAAAITAS
jgi:hypothetical protein